MMLENPTFSSILIIGSPLILGVIVFLLKKSIRSQLIAVSAFVIVHIAITIIAELATWESMTHHGNTLIGYTLIELGPFALVFLAIIMSRTLNTLSARQRQVSSILIAIAIPLLYWFGLLLFVSISVTMGLATL